MGDAATYKLQKEAFVSNNAGDIVFRVNKTCWIAIAAYQLWRTALPLVPRSYRRGWTLVIFEYVILILPLVLGLTAFADHPLRVNALLYFMAGFCYTLAPKQSHASTRAASRGFRVSSLSSSDISKTSETSDNGYMPLADVESEEEKQPVSSSVQLPRSVFYKPFVTVWRAHMMIMTIICILAVDFPIFPRSFGKCETWGTSIMDLGVGSFVFALGFVTASPFLQNLRISNGSARFLQCFKRSSSVLVLGLVRVLMVKGAENTSQTFTIADHRPNLLAQNKEGLVSFAGYLAIYLFGLDTGLYSLPPDPYFAYRSANTKTALKPKTGKLMSVIFSYATVWWTVFGVIHLYMPGEWAVSRRVANSAYVFWVVAFNTSFLLLYLAVDAFSGTYPHSTGLAAPALFQALNKNGLPIFLLANLMTGLINITVQTMFSSNAIAVAILVAYTAFLAAMFRLEDMTVLGVRR
ncbi:MAG: Glucosaminyl phosphatidylinositol (GlcN-PI) nositol acylation protein [Cyphobasidiales sp. Tagirdzhanova-0007]|nr:MAG: Glucosaminyl phosphatidylinositol (GlcN-PI) nositol acylation protein [Cyphobasidiales sp. Tagirdzhanova-0007]